MNMNILNNKIVVSICLCAFFYLLINYFTNNCFAFDEVKKEILNNTKISSGTLIASSDSNNEIDEIVAEDESKEVAVVKRKSNNKKNATRSETATGKDNVKDKNVIKYKNYEKFDFDELDVAGDGASEGSISIAPREERKYQNKLPEKRNFNQEIKKTIDSIN